MNQAIAAKIKPVTAHERIMGTRAVWLRRVMPYSFDHELTKEIPLTFLIYWHLLFQGYPLRGYQAVALNTLFPALYGHEDISEKWARQSGKTMPISHVLGHQICVENWPIVMISAKEEKLKKSARAIRIGMRAEGRPLVADGITETRFESTGKVEPGFVTMSGKPEAQREGEAAKIVWVDEAQDVHNEAVAPDITPMTLSTGGIILTTGIGGVPSSMIETARQDRGTVVIDIPWQDVLKNWCVPDGGDVTYRRRVMKDKIAMRPEIFGAHYECKPIPEGNMAWLKFILPWSEVYPGTPFDPAVMFNRDQGFDVLEVGIDWGKRSDFSCGLLVGKHGKLDKYGARDIVICGYFKAESMDYTEQAIKVREWLESVSYDACKPELMGVGESAVDSLNKELKDTHKRTGERYNLTPVYLDDRDKEALVKDLSQAGQTKRIIFVDAAADPAGKMEAYNLQLADSAINEMRAIGIKYVTNTRMSRLQWKMSHSDWGSAFIASQADPDVLRV